MKFPDCSFILLLLLCVESFIRCGILDDHSEASRSMVKFPKSFYQSHTTDVIPKIISNSVSESSSRETSNEVNCHRVALSRCGHILIRVFKFLDYLNARESFQPRCAFREAFFNCMKVSKEKYCSHRKSARDHVKFRERLAKTLWSTRTCILGSLDYYY